MSRAEAKIAAWFAARAESARQAALRRVLPHMLADTQIGPGASIYGGEQIFFGAGVRIGRDVRLQNVELFAGAKYHPEIRIGAGTSFEDRVHVAAIGRVHIGADVLVASNVLITDHVHAYADPNVAVGAQPLVGGDLTIGDGSHIGEGVCILGSVRIGEHVVVGANAVVAADLPAFSVAVGVPARIVKRWDATSGCWLMST